MRAAVDNAAASRNTAGSDGDNHASVPPSRMGSIPLQPGELEGMQERPTSAPPPPGFGAGSMERNSLARELLWGQSDQYHHTSAPDEIYQSLGLGVIDSNVRPSHAASASGFNDLADVLGSGLMESMEDATRERNNADALLLSKQNTGFNNYHRQTRHAASRLLGASPPNFKDPVYHHSTGGKEAPASLFSATAAPFKMADDYSRAPGANPPLPPTTAPPPQERSGVSRGFPSSLSSPKRAASDVEHSREALKGSTTPVQMFPGQVGDRRALPVTKDIGMNVMEPEGENQFSAEAFSGIRSQRVDSNPRTNGSAAYGQQQQQQHHAPSTATTELERGIQSMWSPIPVGGASQDKDDGASSISESAGGGTEFSARQAENELRPFLWNVNRNKPSRTLAILHVSWLRAPDIRSSCEAFGVLETFRADFSSRGIYFLSYYDIRSAQYAAVELQSILQRMSLAQRSNEEVLVRNCLPLNSSSQFDESQFIIRDLPPEYNEHNLTALLSSFGAVSAVIDQGDGAYAIEFHNIQDTKQALLELDSSQPWGDAVTVEVGLRNPVDRKIGRELLAMISRWRQSENQKINADPGAFTGGAFTSGPSTVQGSDRWRPPVQSSSASSLGGGSAPSEAGGFGSYGRGAPRPQEATQLVLGPDGRYTQVVMQNPTPSYSPYTHRGNQSVDQRHHPQQHQQQPPQQQIIQGPNGQMYIVAPSAQQGYMPQHGANVAYPATVLSNSSHTQDGHNSSRRSGQSSNTPYYTHVVSNDGNSVVSGRSHRSAHSSGQNEDKDTRHLMLDLDAVEAGLDARTSLMVRNIPNKYTQQMLLTEFMENGHGPGVIDFFYLPIDFKNRCNRGYAFINFVDHKDILAFHRRYFGKHWRTFNSDKICDITYARIQGKAAMLKRFENSALMEKDDEYKPLVFISGGPEKGKRLPFPDPATKSS
jgi:RNA recognition motif-containing protein